MSADDQRARQRWKGFTAELARLGAGDVETVWVQAPTTLAQGRAGMAKLIASETGRVCVEESFRIHGGYGYSTEFDVERYFRDAPLMIVGEGTNEIQRNVITRELMRRTSG